MADNKKWFLDVEGVKGKGYLIIIGAGSAGFAAAIRGHELGARVILINDGLIGGTCVNVGCVPSKTLIRAAETLHKGGLHRFKGIESSARLEDFSSVMRQKDSLVENLRQSKYLDVLKAYPNIELIEGRAVIESRHSVRVDDRVLNASRIIIATGSRPWFPDIPGLNESGSLSSATAYELTELPESLIVIGGRYVALETAQLFARFGSRVTILQRSDQILPTEDEDISEALTGYFQDEGLEIITGIDFKSVERVDGEVSVHTVIDGKPGIFKASHLLCATGRRPITNDMGLDEAGVEIADDGSIKVNQHMQSSIPTIYAAGDVVGDPMFVYTAAYEGSLAAANALGGNSVDRDYSALPWVIFSDPQAAGVGLNENQAVAAGLDIEVSKLDLSMIPRSLVARDTRGFIKLIKEKSSDKLLGARILAPEGGEQIMEAALAIRHGIGVSELASMFHPYLTQGEGLKLCALGFGKDINTLSCCSA